MRDIENSDPNVIPSSAPTTATVSSSPITRSGDITISTPAASPTGENDADDMTEIDIDEGDHVSGSNFVSRLERIHGRNNNGMGTSRFFWSEVRLPCVYKSFYVPICFYLWLS